jgi:peroxiredoxin
MIGSLMFAAILAFAQSPPPAKVDPYTRFNAIVARQMKAQAEFDELLGKATNDRERAAAWAKRRGVEFIPEFKTLATDCTTPELADLAAQCWIKVCELGVWFEKPNEAVPAVDVLVKSYVTTMPVDALPMLVHDLRHELGPEKTETTLRTIAQKSTRDPAKANGWFALALQFMSDDPKDVERRKHARMLFERLAKDFTHELSPYGAHYGEVAVAYLFELDHLQVGMEAPDFDATDQDLKEFTLAGYKGKVVVLEFWGMWSDESRYYLRSNKDVVKALADQPFAMIGINSDGEPAAVKQLMAENQVTWRQAIDGSQQGPLAMHWNVRAWPTLYVLDKKGVIRFKNVHAKKLEDAVRALLAE